MKNFLTNNPTRAFLFLGIVCSCLSFSKCSSTDENINGKTQQSTKKEDKHRGVHVFGRLDSTKIQPIIQNNMEWITFVPFGDQKDYDSPIIRYHHPTRRSLNDIDTRWSKKIKLAHDFGFKVFLKPHIWIHAPSDEKWRSDIFPTNEKNWETWKESYLEFILLYAKIAEKNKVELFCIGTEFTRLALEKPDFWENIIQEVQNIYSGKITYAANWYKEFEEITFWKELDFIGIQAYFPLVKNKTPTVQQISKGWKKHLPILKKIHKKFNKKILFTELGYKSTVDSAIEPWNWIDYSSNLSKPVSLETQANCYQAFFDSVWGKDWFAGVHIWQWHTSEKNGGKDNIDFTPRKKPAENVIAKGFGGK